MKTTDVVQLITDIENIDVEVCYEKFKESIENILDNVLNDEIKEQLYTITNTILDTYIITPDKAINIISSKIYIQSEVNPFTFTELYNLIKNVKNNDEAYLYYENEKMYSYTDRYLERILLKIIKAFDFYFESNSSIINE